LDSSSSSGECREGTVSVLDLFFGRVGPSRDPPLGRGFRTGEGVGATGGVVPREFVGRRRDVVVVLWKSFIWLKMMNGSIFDALNARIIHFGIMSGLDTDFRILSFMKNSTSAFWKDASFM